MELNTIQLDRKYFMECVIVRVMKERKVLQHTQLVQEVSSHKLGITFTLPYLLANYKIPIFNEFQRIVNNLFQAVG